MDPFTHALSGALLGRLMTPVGATRRQLRNGLLLGIGAAMFPDIDVVAQPLLDPLTFLNFHRGVTHSLLLWPLLALLLAGVWARLLREGAGGWRQWYPLAALALLLHLGLDLVTSYGTGLLIPLSDHRFSLPISFIIDPILIAIMLAGLGASRWRGRRAAAAALTLVALTIGFEGVLRGRALAVGEAYVQAQGLPSAVVNALPQPLSPFNWTVVVAEPGRYHIARIGLLRSAPPAPAAEGAGLLARVWASYQPATAPLWQQYEKFGNRAVAPLARTVWELPQLAEYRTFAAYPTLYGSEEGAAGQCLWFVDLRFTVGGAPERAPFRYGACRAGAQWRVHQLTDQGAVPL